VIVSDAWICELGFV